MKRIVLTIVLVALTTSLFGQSRSVERFRNKHKPDVSLFFYKSTLRMFARLSTELPQLKDDESNSQQEMPDLASLIDGIEKVKFFTYERPDKLKDEMAQLHSDILEEGYESVMTVHVKGVDIDVMMREKRGKPDGFVVMLDGGDEGTSLIDLEGVPDLSNLVNFAQYMNSNTESFNLLKRAFDEE